MTNDRLLRIISKNNNNINSNNNNNNNNNNNKDNRNIIFKSKGLYESTRDNLFI